MAVGVVFVLGSIYMFVSESTLAASARCLQSSSVSRPERIEELSMSASLESIRETSCSDDISSEKIATFFRVDFATFVATFIQKLVLPIPGLPPTTTRSPAPIPTSTLSSESNFVGVPDRASGLSFNIFSVL